MSQFEIDFGKWVVARCWWLRAKFPGIEVYLTGTIMGDKAFAEASLDDMTTLNPVMFVTLLALVLDFLLLPVLLMKLEGTKDDETDPCL